MALLHARVVLRGTQTIKCSDSHLTTRCFPMPRCDTAGRHAPFGTSDAYGWPVWLSLYWHIPHRGGMDAPPASVAGRACLCWREPAAPPRWHRAPPRWPSAAFMPRCASGGQQVGSRWTASLLLSGTLCATASGAPRTARSRSLANPSCLTELLVSVLPALKHIIWNQTSDRALSAVRGAMLRIARALKGTHRGRTSGHEPVRQAYQSRLP
jgi:hypothetical protein